MPNQMTAKLQSSKGGAFDFAAMEQEWQLGLAEWRPNLQSKEA